MVPSIVSACVLSETVPVPPSEPVKLRLVTIPVILLPSPANADAVTEPVIYTSASACKVVPSTRSGVSAGLVSILWSPEATGIRPVVNPTSLPNEPVFCGPAIKYALSYVEPLIVSYMKW